MNLQGFWEFWNDYKRILKGFSRILEILEGFWDDSGSIP